MTTSNCEIIWLRAFSYLINGRTALAIASCWSLARAPRMPPRLRSGEWAWIAKANALFRSIRVKFCALRASDCPGKARLDSGHARRQPYELAIVRSSGDQRTASADLIRYRDLPQMEKCRGRDRSSAQFF